METNYKDYMTADLMERLNSLYKKLNRESYDSLFFEVTHKTFLNIVYDIKRFLFEALLYGEIQDKYSSRRIEANGINSFMLRSFLSSIKSALSADNFTDIFHSLDELIEGLDSLESSRKYVPYYQTFRSATISAYFSMIAKNLPQEDVVDMITSKKTNERFRFLDNAVMPGAMHISGELCPIKDSIASKNWQPLFDFYGAHKTVSFEGGEHYKKIIQGDLETCNISAKSFDVIRSVLPLTADIDYDKSVLVGANKCFSCFSEIIHLRRLYSLLKENGIVILHLPFYVLSNDFCKEFAKRFKDISVLKNSREESFLSLITLVARKRSNNETDGEDYDICYNQLRNIIFELDYSQNQNYFSIKEERKEYVLTASVSPIKKFIFRGNSLSDSQLRAITLNNSLRDKIYYKKNELFDKFADKKPLLPFTNGQLGLVLVSGFCDGVIEEEDGSCHIVKGRSCKYVTQDATLSEDTVTLRKNYSNKVEINIFESDGTYRNLV